MKVLESDQAKKLVDATTRHRKWLIGGAATLVLYALLGFFVAPWLVKKNAI